MLDYVEERNGYFLNGTRTYSNGDSERVDKRTLYQATKSKIILLSLPKLPILIMFEIMLVK